MSAGTHAPGTLFQVRFTVDADVQLRRNVGLPTRVRQALLDVLEAAMELRKLSGGEVGKDAPLVLKVDAHLVTYSIDVDSECATVWSAEPVRDARGAV
jgi:hypothetical protein